MCVFQSWMHNVNTMHPSWYKLSRGLQLLFRSTTIRSSLAWLKFTVLWHISTFANTHTHDYESIKQSEMIMFDVYSAKVVLFHWAIAWRLERLPKTQPIHKSARRSIHLQLYLSYFHSSNYLPWYSISDRILRIVLCTGNILVQRRQIVLY